MGGKTPNPKTARLIGAVILCIGIIFSIMIPKTAFGQDEKTGKSLEFPGLEPFQFSRMWPLFDKMYEMKGNFDSALFVMKGSADNLNLTVETMEKNGYDVWPDSSDPAVYKGGLKKNADYMVLPWLMAKLEPLWKKPEWYKDDIELANKVAALLKIYKDAPEVNFKADETHNQRELEKIVAWFQKLTEDTETYANMIFTLDDGPWRPLPFETDKLLPAIDSQDVADDIALRLCNIERCEGNWCLQCVKNGDLFWSAILSKIPEGDFGFAEREPTYLWEYGWKIHMVSSEYVHLYLNREGQLLFYFTSW